MVSVIIPMFNSDKTIEKCLNSVLSQTIKSIQVIVVDDGSKDNSCYIVEKICKKDDRCMLIKKNNGGVSSARNLGLQYIKGEYVTFIDSDDFYLDSNYIELMTKSMEPDVDLVVTGITRVNQDSTTIVYPYEDKTIDIIMLSKDYIKYYDQGLLNSSCNKLYRSRLIKVKFDEKMTFGEDAVFVNNYLLQCRKIRIINSCGYGYYYNDQSSSHLFKKDKQHDFNQTNKYHESIYKIWKCFLSDEEADKKIISLRANAYKRIAQQTIKKRGLKGLLQTDYSILLTKDKDLINYTQLANNGFGERLVFFLSARENQAILKCVLLMFIFVEKIDHR